MTCNCEECKKKVYANNKIEKKSWLCRIGFHDWQPVGSYGWGAGHPVYCTRCDKGGTDSDFGIV